MTEQEYIELRAYRNTLRDKYQTIVSSLSAGKLKRQIKEIDKKLSEYERK